MISTKKILAIIPARKGSKRLPGKNIKELHGKPLISWTIDAAKQSKYIDKIIISTDDSNIIEIANKYCLNNVDLRPDFLSTDTSSTEDVLLYEVKKQKEMFDILVLLQPTSPLRTHINIDEAIEYYIKSSATNVVSVTESEHNPLWTCILNEDNNMAHFGKQLFNMPKEKLKYYRLNGAIYILDIQSLIKNKKIGYDEKTFAYVMDAFSSVDIDNQLDFDFANFLLNKKLLISGNNNV